MRRMGVEETLTTSEAATRLGISAPRIRQYVLGGRLPAAKHGRDWLIKASDLERLERRAYRRQGAGQAGQTGTSEVGDGSQS